MIHLYFEEYYNCPIELGRVVVTWGIDSAPVVSCRGRESHNGHQEGAFTWSNGVKALCELILKAKFEKSETNSSEEAPATISGIKGSSASSLDYAIAKQPRWIIEMFGQDKNGISKIRRLIKRHNPEGKRPGPITLSWNSAACPPAKISIYLNNARLFSAEKIQSLLASIRSEPLNQVTNREHEQTKKPPDAINLPVFNLADAVILNIHNDAKTIKEIEKSLLAKQIKFSNSELETAIDHLTSLGVLKSKKQDLELAPEFTKKRNDILDWIKNIKHEYMIPVPVNGKGKNPIHIAKQSESECVVRFQNICQMEIFLEVLMSELALRFKDEGKILWHIRRPWLPLLKPGGVCRVLTNNPILKYAKLITTGSCPTNEWVKKFYSRLGIESVSFSEPILDNDFFVNGEVVVFYGIPKDITVAAHSFLDKCEDVAKFDSISFYQDILQQPCQPYIHLAVAPGLARQLYDQAMRHESWGHQGIRNKSSEEDSPSEESATNED